LGTGRARTWNDLAHALFSAVSKKVNIEYIEMPEILKPRYQYFTEAKMDKLRSIGYDKPFASLEESVKDYCVYLNSKRYL
jgi:ADP-L-glycero-D-manno-heptose 6-epimerase